ncbi:hypothetical protein SPAB_00790 [Salmonella enterica subsp. enterica serovar Paratyphi B str. SPB7]|uniref:Uncharacterized protein n=1 Tax=Salmonella paratyphi B (strain ATCC BAA-1250 / SPB7) TaxID=1016998 RepID=A0A6C6YYZ7_SALPB|nr:hypothetical protein SPAB_00790 [Salmonella enterica subsp. enterica serovar Paratyphi B str. SPB7]
MHILCGIGGCATSRKQNRNCNRRNPAQNISQNRLRFDHVVCFPLKSLTINIVIKMPNVMRLITCTA